MRHLFIILFLLFEVMLIAQVTNPVVEQQAKSIIASKGLDEQAVRERLLAEDIDIDRIQPSDLPTLQPRIEAILNEMEAEKNGKTTKPNEAPATTPVSEQPVAPSKAEQAAEQVAKANSAQLPPTDIYGHHLFRQKDVAVFRTTNEVKPPDSYVLSTGDELTISVFGASQFDSKYTINKEGYISPTGMPKIFLKGVRLGQARELLRSRFANFYRFAPEQFAVSLTAARTITVNIFGETNNVGSFTLSAVNTAFNALVASGGPTDLGTVREIKVIRNGKTSNLDLYSFINNPALQFEFFLEDNDIIHIPVAQRVVAIEGSVRRPYRYEVLANENLVQLIEFAGGLSNNAYREIVQVSRFINNEQVLIDVNLRELVANKRDFPLLDGDKVVVKAIPGLVKNTATIEGAIDFPGEYSLTENPRLSSLLSKSVLKNEARTDIAFLSRRNSDSTYQLVQINIAQALAQPGSAADLTLKPYDALRILSQVKFADRYTFSVKGAVRDTITDEAYDPTASITLERAILLAGGLSADANGLGYIIRTNPNNTKEKSYLPVDIRKALDQPASTNNVVLEPGDAILAFSALTYTDESEVNVVGAVRNPGRFKYSPTLNINDVLQLAGGMRLEAARNRVDVYRVAIQDNVATRTLAYTLEVDAQNQVLSIRENGQVVATDAKFALAPYDEIVVRTAPDFELQEFVELNGQVRYPGRYALVSDNERLVSIIERAGGLSPEADQDAVTIFRNYENTGFVITNLRKAMLFQSSEENHLMRDGDVVNIPVYKSLVTIKTANTDANDLYKADLLRTGQINIAFNEGKRANWYIKNYAGGYGTKAKRTKVSVLQPNGDINRTVNLGLFCISPKVTKGSIISIPAKPEKEKKAKGEEKKVDWDKKLSQVLAFASIVTSAILAYTALNNDDTP
jgi:protein involved in polysaccharide export with SLBB domain